MREKSTPGFWDLRNLLTTLVGSYVLFVVGIVGTYCSEKYLPDGLWKTFLLTIFLTITATSVLNIFFEHFGRKSLMRNFIEEVRTLVQAALDDFRAKSEQLKRSGIIDFGVMPPGKHLEDMLCGAKQSIMICKTWIPENDRDQLRAGLQRALVSSKENSGLAVKILCLDPDSPLVGQRLLDSHPGTVVENASKEGHQLIVEGLRQIMDSCRDGQRYLQVEIRIYRNVPAVSLYSTENRAWIGWYWFGTEASGGLAVSVLGEGDGNLGHAARGNFNKIWEQASQYAPEVEDTAFSDASEYVIRPPDSLLAELAATLSPDKLRPMLARWPEIEEYGHGLVNKLRDEGYCIVRNFPFSDERGIRRNQFLLLACACGEPTDHKPPHGVYVDEVKPRGILNRQVETYSEHDREARLHTDSHYNDRPENFVAFLMEQQAEYGGRNILLRFSALKKEMQDTTEGRSWFKYFQNHKLPSAKPSRYSESSTGDPEIIRETIIDENGEAIRFRDDTILAAIEHLVKQKRQVQDKDQEKGLDFLRRMIYRSPDRRGVTLSNGDMLFVNNHTVLHARTGFVGLRRLLLRIRFNA